MQAQILVQATQPTTHMPDIPATGWGVAAAVFTVLVTKGFELLSQKEKQKLDSEKLESDLVTKLVESLQEGQEKLLDQLVVAQKDHHSALVKLEVAINNF